MGQISCISLSEAKKENCTDVTTVIIIIIIIIIIINIKDWTL